MKQLVLITVFHAVIERMGLKQRLSCMKRQIKNSKSKLVLNIYLTV